MRVQHTDVGVCVCICLFVCVCVCTCFAGDLEGSLKLSVSPHHPHKAEKAVRKMCQTFRNKVWARVRNKGEGLSASKSRSEPEMENKRIAKEQGSTEGLKDRLVHHGAPNLPLVVSYLEHFASKSHQKAFDRCRLLAGMAPALLSSIINHKANASTPPGN